MTKLEKMSDIDDYRITVAIQLAPWTLMFSLSAIPM